jgi:hypothetical protein
MTTVQVYIAKQATRGWLNLHFLTHDIEIDGITWDGSELLITAPTMQEAKERALALYWRCDASGIKNACARLRHRFGHNGHGWPPVRSLCVVCKDQGKVSAAVALCNELKRPVCLDHAFYCRQELHGTSPLDPDIEVGEVIAELTGGNA